MRSTQVWITIWKFKIPFVQRYDWFEHDVWTCIPSRARNHKCICTWIITTIWMLSKLQRHFAALLVLLPYVQNRVTSKPHMIHGIKVNTITLYSSSQKQNLHDEPWLLATESGSKSRWTPKNLAKNIDPQSSSVSGLSPSNSKQLTIHLTKLPPDSITRS